MSSFCLLLIFIHVASSLNWFIGTNITLEWQAHTLKEKTVNVSLCITQPISNNCNFIIQQNVLNSGKIQLVSSDFDFKAKAAQLQIEQNSTGYFAVSSTSSDGIKYVPCSETLHILQTVITSTPIYGGTMSQNSRKLITNSFDLMLYKDIFRNMDINNIAACFVQLNLTTFEWKEILHTNITFITNTNKTQDIFHDYLIIRNINGIALQLKQANIAYGGPYFLWFGLKDSNYYSINTAFEYLIYDESSVSFNLAKDTFKAYDNIAMNISVGNELLHIPIYVALTNNKDDIFVAECKSHLYDYYHSFGWKFNNSNKIETGLLYNASIYWSLIDSSHILHEAIVINITDSSAIEAIAYNKHEFNAASNNTVSISSSFNIGTKLVLHIKQCIETQCKWFRNVMHFMYEKKQSHMISIPQTVQTSMFTKGLRSYLVAAAYLCANNTMNVTTAIDIVPLFTRYIIGDMLHDIEWNPSLIAKIDEMIELRFLYWNNDTTTKQILSLGLIKNNGSLSHFTPNLSMNMISAKQLLIENGAIAIFNLFAIESKKEVNITSRAYHLFHALSIDDDFSGAALDADANNDDTKYMMHGMLVESLIDDDKYSFDAFLINNSNAFKQYRLRNISWIINKTNCVNGFCPFILMYQFSNASNDGLYLFGISRYENNESSFSTNYFVKSSNESCQFLVYSSSSMKIEMDAISNATIDIIQYEYKSISIKYESSDINNIMIYATLENVENIFIFECGAHHMTEYTSFGWKFSSLLDGNIGDIRAGFYEFKLYWNTPKTKTVIGMNEKYKLNTLYPLHINVVNDSSANMDIISVQHLNSNKLYKGHSSDFVFSSSIAAGSEINVYYEQCMRIEKENCIYYYPNDNSEPYKFYIKEAIVRQTERINISNNISLKVNDEDYKTWIVIDIKVCNKKIIKTRHNITIYEIEKSQKRKNKLGASAVIAVVCASLIVLILAIWYIFMINSGGDGYRHLHE